MTRLDHTRTDETTKRRIRLGAALGGFTQGEFVERAVAAYLKELGLWHTVERNRKREDKGK